MKATEIIKRLNTLQIMSQHNDVLIDTLYEFFKIEKQQFYHNCLKKSKLRYNPSLFSEAQRWANVADFQRQEIKEEKEISLYNVLLDVFADESKHIQIEVIKHLFIKYAKNIIEGEIQVNKAQYVNQQQLIRSQPFIYKSEKKIQMESVKRLKARWHH
eukprot:359287_1